MTEAFTYDGDGLATAISQVRLLIGDTDAHNGVRPNGRNFSDGEITFFLTQAGSVVGKAASIAVGTLATEYTAASRAAFAKGDSDSVSAARTYAEIAKSFREQATALRSTAEIDDATDGVNDSDVAEAFGDTDADDAYFALPPRWLR